MGAENSQTPFFLFFLSCEFISCYICWGRLDWTEAIRNHLVKQQSLLLSWHMGSFGLPWKLPLLIIWLSAAAPSLSPYSHLFFLHFLSIRVEKKQQQECWRAGAETDALVALWGNFGGFIWDSVRAGGRGYNKQNTFRFHFCHYDSLGLKFHFPFSCWFCFPWLPSPPCFCSTGTFLQGWGQHWEMINIFWHHLLDPVIAQLGEKGEQGREWEA